MIGAITPCIRSIFSTGFNYSPYVVPPNNNKPEMINRLSDLHADNKPREKCGVFGIYKFNSDQNTVQDIAKGLFKLQHRGQEAAGAATSNGKFIRITKGEGLVGEVFNNRDLSKHDNSFIGIGHTLYANTKKSHKAHVQPVESGNRIFTLVHNGNIPDLSKMQEFLKSKGKEVEGRNDSELIADTIYWWQDEILRNNPEDKQALEKAIKEAVKYFDGAYCLIIMTKDKLIALRDPTGLRPFSIAKLPHDEGIVFASETSAFHPFEAEKIRDVKPGEMIIVNKTSRIQDLEKVQDVIFPKSKLTSKIDIFEFVYFARPDSVIEGVPVYEARRRMGIETAKEFKAKILDKKLQANPDMVVPVVDGGTAPAVGFAEELGVPTIFALFRDHHRRTFIDGGKGVDDKFAVIKESVKDKNVVLLDDSIVRGNTSKSLVKKIKAAGAKSVTFVSASPPVLYPDFYGIDLANQAKLIAAQKNNNLDEIARGIAADSVFYPSINAVVKAVGLPKEKVNLSIFDGEYPVNIGAKIREIRSITN